MGEPDDLPSLGEQIAWLRQCSEDAAMLRHRFVGQGHVTGARASQDAAMWQAVLLTLLTIAELANERGR